MQARSRLDRRITEPDPGTPGQYYHPIYVSVKGSDGSVREMALGRELVTYPQVLTAIGHFSTGKAFYELEVWRFVTFQFLHVNMAHLLFNMMGLYFVGGMVERRLGFKKYAAFYLLCGVCGAIMYLVLNLLGWGMGWRLPGVLFTDPYTPLVGASAGVFGVLLAAAYLCPREIVYVMFAIPMPLKMAVYLFTLIAAMNLFMGGHNAGGDAAHIGGAIAGAFFVRRPHLLNDFFREFEVLGSTGRQPRTTQPVARGRGIQPDDVDAILEKASRYGLESLTEAEEAALRRASRGMR